MNKQEMKDMETIATLNSSNDEFRIGIMELIKMPINIHTAEQWSRKFLLLLRKHKLCRFHTTGRIWVFTEDLGDRIRYYNVTSFDSKLHEPNEQDKKEMHDIIIACNVQSSYQAKAMATKNILYYSQFGCSKYKRKTVTKISNMLTPFLRKLMNGTIFLDHECDGKTGKGTAKRHDVFQ